MDRQILMIADAVLQAQEGVLYDDDQGAECPYCKDKVRVSVTRPWRDSQRIRYHRCDNPECVLAYLNQTIKSLQKFTRKKSFQLQNGNTEGVL
jgi:hypothetical protein